MYILHQTRKEGLMFCRSCGKELVGNPQICPGCGLKPMNGTGFCPTCGAATTPLTDICPKCGNRVVGKSGHTWKPTVAGILDIISGVFGLVIGGIFMLVPYEPVSYYPYYDYYEEDIAVGAILFMVGIVALIGGMFALRRKVWGLALAGSIFALFCGGILGLLAIIWTAMAKTEFE